MAITGGNQVLKRAAAAPVWKIRHIEHNTLIVVYQFWLP